MPPTTFRHPSRRGVLRGASAVGLTAVAGPALARSATAAGPPPPNVIVVSIDDLGWREFGAYGSTFNETPHIDRLAREGMRFTRAYPAAPICSPTRAALMTGLYPARTGITDFLREAPAASGKFLSPDVPTVPDFPGPYGCTTALIGKWHLTETYSGEYTERPGNPYAHGLDEAIASERLYIADGDYFHPYRFMPDLPARTPGEYLTDRLADEAVDFVARHRDRRQADHRRPGAAGQPRRHRGPLPPRLPLRPGGARQGHHGVRGPGRGLGVPLHGGRGRGAGPHGPRGAGRVPVHGERAPRPGHDHAERAAGGEPRVARAGPRPARSAATQAGLSQPGSRLPPTGRRVRWPR
ncbi:sulfatase-like hydrolase/transferase [Streptomyces sp. B22F1]|uniref:sulfatase-like hydrolase/transferase n=1 Tax=Streptomyces sp. B22F1 TaxID=3153566 RepID=UPI000AE88468